MRQPYHYAWTLGLAALVAAGAWMRTLPAGSMRVFRHPATTVNLYFVDGGFLFPVSRQFQTDDRLPRAALEALLAGPHRSRTVKSAVPDGVAVRSISVVDGVARIDLSRDLGQGDQQSMALASIRETMTRVPGIRSVALTVLGAPLAAPTSRTPLLYFPSASGLVAIPAKAGDPRVALSAFLAGPPGADMTGVPSDVRLLTYDYDSSSRRLSLGFTYTPALRALAVEQPARTRTLLLGLIATLTDFADVQTVRLDFGGQSRLGLGECSDLLRTPQPGPALLNDERLLD
jgi:spore germination protein GerM